MAMSRKFILFTFFLLIIDIECRMDTDISLTTTNEKDETQIAGPPSELRVHASYDSIQVSWLPPSDDNVMIRGYQIGWGVNLPDIEKINVNATLRQYTIQRLKPNREYVISLRAFNHIGHGFPIYETVKTTFYSKIPSSSAAPNLYDDLLTPVGLLAKTLSSSQIHITWVDPNEEPFNQYYTIKYGLNGDLTDQMKELNTTETEHIFEGLRPDTQYEFAVKLANSQLWSLTASNRTFPAPPSSPPRDLTILGPQMERDDPTSVTLNWQPPKYANGEIKEYILFYTTNMDMLEREWMMGSTKGDQLSMQIDGLRQNTTYYFKLQARNVKGYGPFSSLISFTIPENIRNNINNIFYRNNQFKLISANITNILLGIVTLIFIVLIISLIIFCSQRRSTSNRSNKNIRPQKQGYIAGRRESNYAQNDDLWIKQQNGGRFATLVNTSGTIGGLVCEDFDFDAAPNATMNDGQQRIVFLDHQQKTFIAPMKQMNNQQYLNSPIPPHHPHLMPNYHQAQQLNTMSRNYPNHLGQMNGQDNLTPATPRNPHVVYARADRQPIAKVEFEGPSSASPFEDENGSFTEIRGFYDEKNETCPSPPLPTNESERPNSGYQVVNNPSLRSFNNAKTAGKLEEDKMREPPGHQKIAHIVRPIICVNAANSSPNAIRNVTAQRTPPMIGQRFTAIGNGKVPVGRATAQPRVNVANGNSTESSASPYSSVRVQRNSREINEENGAMVGHHQTKMQQNNRLINGGSMEELNVQEIDQMICTLQELQHEFTTNGEN